jgi:bifunctional non-homologous end joining protein LigD
VPLEAYRRKRDFSRTPEPSGGAAEEHEGGGTAVPERTVAAPPRGVPAARGGRFVVQRHRATRLHYDFRLEIDGVLVSWAVPRGPTLDPGVRRMAIHVEDHPIEYLDFEGTIPAGQYGGGDVIVWDWGTWTPEETDHPGRAVANGELKFRLEGERLRGRYTIVRTSGRGGERARRAFEESDGEQWLLIKKRDADARPGWDAEDLPTSVKTGRSNDEVKADRDAVWISSAPAPQAEIDLTRAVDAPLPPRIEPMLATLATRAFRDEDWLFEIKWDGYRVGATVNDGKVRIWTRGGQDAETYFPGLLNPPSWIEAGQAVVDGEVVALDDAGRPDFSLLQERTGVRGAPNLVYQAFDLLYLDGQLLLDVPLEDRKRLLRSVLRDQPRVRFADHVVTEGLAFYEAAATKGLEGIVAKRRRSSYQPGRRTSDWLKLKIRPEQELVVGGWTPGEGSATELGALVVGVYEGQHLRYAGKVGSGLTGRTRADLRARLAALETPNPPFDPPPDKDRRGRWGGDLRGVTWVRPELVIRAELGGWTREGYVRQSSYKGLELGRNPGQVARERPQETTRLVEEAEAGEPADTDPGGPEEPVGDVVAGRRGPKDESRGRLHGWTATPDELAALAGLGKAGRWTVGGFELALTNLDKVLFPPAPDRPDEPPITKRELIAYFALIAPAMLPHLADRPLNLHRYPDGAEHQGFWQKDIPATAPGWLRRWHEPGVHGREANDHLVADRVATLCWLGNQAAFEIHAWTSRIDDPFRPTFALIDIDPGTQTTWEETLVLARLYRTALEHLGVRGYPKLTGQRGIQVWIPVVPRYDFADTSDWVEKLSRAVASTVPDLVSWEWAKEQRRGRSRLDYTQNAQIKTLVAPYAVRPQRGAPVSAPISWDELDDPTLRADRWTIRTLPERVAKRGDLFARAQDDLQVLPPLG